MRIDTFLQQSPIFAVNRAARRFDSLTASLLAHDGLSFLEGLILAALFFEAPQPVKPSLLADTLATTRGNISHCISSLESKHLIQRSIDPSDARAYLLSLRPAGKRTAMRVIGAFDKLQAQCEQLSGKSGLSDTLKTLRKLDALCER